MRKGCAGFILRKAESQQWQGSFYLIGENSAVHQGLLHDGQEEAFGLSGAWFNAPNADWFTNSQLVRSSVCSPKAFDALDGLVHGFFYSKNENSLLLHVDFARQRPIFYFQDQDFFAFAPSVAELIKLLKNNRKTIEPDQEGAAMLITFASILGIKTLIKGVHKLLPGHSMIWKGSECSVFPRTNLLSIERNVADEAEAVQMLATAFEKATRQMIAFNQNTRLQQINLLSGGIDSRVVLLECLHQKAKTEALCFSKRDYLDHRISEKIAGDFNVPYHFYDLKSGEYMISTDSVDEYDGTINYLASAHHRAALSSLEKIKKGVVVAGQLGNEILAEFFKPHATPDLTFGSIMTYGAAFALCKNAAYEAWNYTPDITVFKLYNRGFLYTNSAAYSTIDGVLFSPFTSAEFVKCALQLHPRLVNNHRVYLDWIQRSYPQAQRYKWERYRTVPVRGLGLKVAKLKMKAMMKLVYARNNFIGASMTPVDGWYAQSQQLRDFFIREYKEKENVLELYPQLKELIEKDYINMSVINKGSVITLLNASKKYFG
jgi:asparagine synthase (glutamine-hydrolysing)